MASARNRHDSAEPTGYQEGVPRMEKQVRKEKSHLGRQLWELNNRIYQGLEGYRRVFEQNNIQAEINLYKPGRTYNRELWLLDFRQVPLKRVVMDCQSRLGYEKICQPSLIYEGFAEWVNPRLTSRGLLSRTNHISRQGGNKGSSIWPISRSARK